MLLSINASFRTADNEELRRTFLMLRPSIQIPHKDMVRSLLKNKYEEVLPLLLQDLPQNAKISLAMDVWQSPFAKSFLAITAYFIDQRWQYREVRYSNALQ
jgi:hypothetical protein